MTAAKLLEASSEVISVFKRWPEFCVRVPAKVALPVLRILKSVVVAFAVELAMTKALLPG